MTDHIVLKIGNKKIRQESSVRSLGVLLDSTLSWNKHLTHYASKDTITLIYHAVFAPFLSYGVSVWGLTHPSWLDPVSISQKENLESHCIQ